MPKTERTMFLVHVYVDIYVCIEERLREAETNEVNSIEKTDVSA